MSEKILIELGGVFALGIGAQWLAWRLKMPSILLLLLSGIVAGPISGWIKPDRLFGPLLLPIVSLAVAVILFEGGLSLRISELQEIGGIVLRLVSLGAAVTATVITLAAHILAGLDWNLALLLGAILVVSGPTVIGPLLSLVRPRHPIGAILRWESIVIDPIGAVLALLVYKSVFTVTGQHPVLVAAQSVAATLLVGGGAGIAGAALLVFLLRRYWIPDFLQSAVSLTFVLGAYVLSDTLSSTSGLLAVTVMGIALANQKAVGIRQIVEFKENLRVLFLSILFILLAARLEISQLTHDPGRNLAFLAVVIFVARPVSALLSTASSSLTRNQRLYLSWMAPRGIVAASVSSVFTLELQASGHPQAGRLVPLTFLVIIGTVLIYGLTSLPLARRLGIAKPDEQGVLIVGAHVWAQRIAQTLVSAGIPVLIVDSNRANIASARLAGLNAHYANILSEYITESLSLDAIGCLLALTPNDEVNSLASLHFIEIFGRQRVYQLAPNDAKSRAQEMTSPHHLHGRFLFAPSATFQSLSARFEEGASVKATSLTPEFDFHSYQARQQSDALPLFLITETKTLVVLTADETLTPRPGQTLIGLISPVKAGERTPLSERTV